MALLDGNKIGRVRNDAAAPCRPGQQQALLHQPVDELGSDGIVAGGSTL